MLLPLLQGDCLVRNNAVVRFKRRITPFTCGQIDGVRSIGTRIRDKIEMVAQR